MTPSVQIVTAVTLITGKKHKLFSKQLVGPIKTLIVWMETTTASPVKAFPKPPKIVCLSLNICQAEHRIQEKVPYYTY